MLALSTVWNAHRYNKGADIIKDIRQAGAQAAELNFALDAEMVSDIRTYCLENGFPITSLHNFCPVPTGLKRDKVMPDHFSLSSSDEQERRLAVDNTKNSILTAQSCKACCLILHCGMVEMEDRTKQLISLYRANKQKTSEYQQIMRETIEERKAKSDVHLEQLLKSLEELALFASDKNVVLGLENRFYFNEMPFWHEFGAIFNSLKDQRLKLWLDTGHNFVLEQLGFIPKGRLLEEYSGRLFGCHLHNVTDLHDHQAVTRGDIDFKIFRPYVKKETIKVMEFHSQATVEEIRDSIRYLEEIFP